MKLGQGNIYRSVCQELCPWGEGVSRPRPRGRLGVWLGGGVSRSRPRSRRRLGGLAGGCQSPHSGGCVSRPTPGRVCPGPVCVQSKTR